MYYYMSIIFLRFSHPKTVNDSYIEQYHNDIMRKQITGEQFVLSAILEIIDISHILYASCCGVLVIQ
jgi:hypothetical protein